MPSIDSYVPGTPSWADLATPDVDSSVAFYGDLFGGSHPSCRPRPVATGCSS